MFRITALPCRPFAPLFAMDPATLARHRARRVVADRQPGFPCRVSLRDAAVGETLVLVHHVHQHADSPFHAAHAIYVRETAVQARPTVDTVPDLLRTRTLSLRGFDAAGMMCAADLADGKGLEAALRPMLAQPAVAYVHLHYAAPGCYAARVDRA